MARTESRFRTSAWRPGSDWLTLPFTHKGVYKMVLDQGEVEYTGVVALTPTKWSKLFGLPLNELIEIIEDLNEDRYFIVDWDYEELLIRTFIRNDEVYRQPNLMRSAQRSLDSVSSLIIRAEILTELQRIESDHTETTPAGSKGVISSMIDTLKKDPPIPSLGLVHSSEEPNREPFPEGHGEPIPEPFGEPNSEGVTGKGGPDPKGVGGRGSTTYLKEVSGSTRSAKPDRGSDDDPEFARWWARYPRKVSKGQARAAWRKAIKKAEPDDLVEALENYAEHWRRSGTATQYIPHPSTWLNGECWADEYGSPSGHEGPVIDIWALSIRSARSSSRNWTWSRRPAPGSKPAAPPTRTSRRHCPWATGRNNPWS
jgi:hypothetical protein